MPIVDAIMKVVRLLPPGALDAIYRALCAILASDDPRQAAERAAAAAASESASEALLRRLLRRS